MLLLLIWLGVTAILVTIFLINYLSWRRNDKQYTLFLNANHKLRQITNKRVSVFDMLKHMDLYNEEGWNDNRIYLTDDELKSLTMFNDDYVEHTVKLFDMIIDNYQFALDNINNRIVPSYNRIVEILHDVEREKGNLGDTEQLDQELVSSYLEKIYSKLSDDHIIQVKMINDEIVYYKTIRASLHALMPARGEAPVDA